MIIKILIISLFFVAVSTATETDPMELIYSVSKSYKDVRDYTAIFIKQERIRGILHREERILLKFRKPFLIYMKWLKGPGEGREILYDPKQNNGKMVVRPSGLITIIIPVLYIDPGHPMVKNRSRHTIKEAGIGMTIRNLIDQLELAKSKGELDIKFIGEDVFDGRPCLKFEAFFPEDDLYYAAHIVTYIDKEYNLPTHIFIYDWKEKLLERASYKELNINVGLSEMDFNPRNPAYEFNVK